jgi:hypothetical protein
MAQVKPLPERPLSSVGDRVGPLLQARGGHGRRGPRWLGSGSDGHKLNRRVRPVRDDHLPRWQGPQACGSAGPRGAQTLTDGSIGGNAACLRMTPALES